MVRAVCVARLLQCFEESSVPALERRLQFIMAISTFRVILCCEAESEVAHAGVELLEKALEQVLVLARTKHPLPHIFFNPLI